MKVLKFLEGGITIYEELDENQFRNLYELSRMRIKRKSGRIPEARKSERVSEAMPIERLADPRNEAMRIEEETRMAAEVQRKMASEKEAKRSSVTLLDPSEDIVDSLINKWTLPPNSPPATLSPESLSYKTTERSPGPKPGKKSPSPNRARECSHRFREGEWMYACDKCGKVDSIVFCVDCFHATDHAGHPTSKRKSRSNEDFCDCGHSDSVSTPVRCSIHGTFDSWGPV